MNPGQDVMSCFILLTINAKNANFSLSTQCSQGKGETEFFFSNLGRELRPESWKKGHVRTQSIEGGLCVLQTVATISVAIMNDSRIRACENSGIIRTPRVEC